MKKILIPATMFLVAIFAWCDDGADLTAYYDSHFVRVGYSLFGGLNVAYQGSTYSPGLGLNARVADVLRADPEVRGMVASYQAKNMTGNVFLWGGLAAMIGGEYLYLDSAIHATTTNAYGQSTYDASKLNMTGLYIAGAGSIAMLVAPFLLGGSYEDLVAAVNTFDRNLMRQAPRP